MMTHLTNQFVQPTDCISVSVWTWLPPAVFCTEYLLQEDPITIFIIDERDGVKI